MESGPRGVWPKTCGCGRTWTREQWRDLPFVARTPDHEGGLLEMRTCMCRSTLAVHVDELDDPNPRA